MSGLECHVTGKVAARTAGPRAWRAADAAFLVMFLFSVAVQFNDPDPVTWSAIYALAAMVCGLSLAGRLRPWFPVVVGLTALLWAATIAPGVVGRVPFLEMFEAFEMKDLAIEESREMYGLVLVFFWMAVLTARTWLSTRTRSLVSRSERGQHREHRKHG
jgi:hypothetical protein